MSKRYEHLHYCEYRDTKTGLIASNYVDVMNEQDQKIKDLEAKLAESEKTAYVLQTKLNMKEYEPVFCRLAGRDCEELGKVEQLKQQLAEKEKEVLKWKNKKIKCLTDKLLGNKDLAIQTVEEIREDFRQNSFCNDYHEYIVNMEIFEYFNNKIKSLKGEK